MLDDFLVSASEVSRLLLPIIGVIVLIALAILIFKIVKLVNAIPTTMDKVNDTIDTTHESIKKLDVPLETIAGISHTVDNVNKSATGIVSSMTNFAIKNSDSIMNWTKDFFNKDDKKTDNEPEEEDFGVYE